MLRASEGTYNDGTIELQDIPQDTKNGTRVLAIFIESDRLDPATLKNAIERLETIAGIQQGLQEVDADRTRPIEDFAQEMASKYEISS